MLFIDPAAAQAEAARLDEALERAEERANTEEDFRIDAVTAIRDVARRYGLELELRAERTIASGRADAVYNRVVIEFEPPRSMRSSLTHTATAHAVQQTKDYMTGLADELGTSLENLSGIAFDGSWYVFVRSVGGEWRIEGPLARNPVTTGRLLRHLLSLGTGRALTADNLVEDFGGTTGTARRSINALYAALNEEGEGAPLRDALFGEWRRLFGAISGIDPAGMDKQTRDALRPLMVAVDLRTADPALFLFAVHTYFALVTKLVAYSAVGRQAVPLGLGLGEWVGLDDESLRLRVRDLENGGLFRTLGLRNFLEADFFGWYESVWRPETATAVRAIADALDEYDPGSIDARPELTRDLLKGLYQYLLPRALRHRLGEYYTPDWLAEIALDEAGFTGEADQRCLDPSCGSGTFLVLAIARIKATASADPTDARALLNRVLSDVVGFDLNPLAVIAARANYVLALGDLLTHRTSDIDIPVYLADSVRPPAESPTVFARGVYHVDLSVESFDFPSWANERRTVERLTSVMEQSVVAGVSTDAFLSRVSQFAPAAESEADHEAVATTYARLTQLHSDRRDGIWTRIIKNAFMPLFVGRFSHIIGNPPWIAWENLSAAYRGITAELWDHYQLHPRREEMRMPAGRARSDMAILFTYACIDRYANDGGTLVFLTTQSVFKSEAAGRGFRRFRLPGDVALKVERADDFTAFQPFEAAQNRTAMFRMTRDATTEYPIPYVKWEPSGIPRQPPNATAVTRIRQGSIRRDWIAEPIIPGDRGSPWITGPLAVVRALETVVGPSGYPDMARKGTDTRGANAVFWVEELMERPDGIPIVRNLIEAGRGERWEVQRPIEPDLLYPLIRGRDLQRWAAIPRARIVLPYLTTGPGTPLTEHRLATEYPLTHSYFAEFERLLRRRPRFRNFNPAEGEPWELYGVGAYSFARYKVCWREQMATFTVAVAQGDGGKAPIVDHKLVAVGLDDANEAYYLAAVLNSTPVRVLVDSYALELSLSSAVLDYVAVPRFSRANAVHTALSDLGRRAHTALIVGQAEDVQVRIDTLAGQLWNMQPEALSLLSEYMADLAPISGDEDTPAEDDTDVEPI